MKEEAGCFLFFFISRMVMNTRYTILTIFSILTSCFSSVAFSDVRVRIKQGQTRLMLQGDVIAISVKEQGKERKKIPICLERPYCSVEASYEKKGILISSVDKKYGPFQKIEISSRTLRAGSVLIPNTVQLISRADAFDLIAHVDIEDYIEGVVAAEVPNNWPLETLKAQAVAARSYALATMKGRAHKEFDVESNTLDQVFRHTSDSQAKTLKLVRQAINETRGIVLFHKSRILKAFYHSDCGGRTSSSKLVWKNGVDTGLALDSSCELRKSGHDSKWQLLVNKADIEKKVSKFLKISDGVRVQLLASSSLNVDRIYDIPVLNLATQGVAKISGNDFRALIGFEKLKSTKFKAYDLGDFWKIEGQGFGHGVGLCQWGSRNLGMGGSSFKKILMHYYPLASLRVIKE